MARSLNEEGERLMASHNLEVISADSLVPKCDELNRMAEALASALERRAKVLRLSKNMHEQISQVRFITILIYSTFDREMVKVKGQLLFGESLFSLTSCVEQTFIGEIPVKR